MANTVLHESKHILKRVLIGAVTGVSGAAIIYFLGFNNPSKPSETEIKKNTVKTWKSYVELENNMLTQFDSSLAKANRNLIAYKEKYTEKTRVLKEFRKQDSLTFSKSLSDLEELKETKDIDKDFYILLDTRISYLKEQLSASMNYKTRFAVPSLDSVMGDSEKTNQIQEMNKWYNEKMNNLTERIGRSLESLAGSLSKKYKYSFLMSDFRFYPVYLSLKKWKSQKPKKPDVAPADPDKSKPVLPD
jgi:hypothetical protein